jgi:hypothetical protein
MPVISSGLLTFNFIHFMAAFWAVFTFGGSSPAITTHGSLDPKQEIQIQIQISSSIKKQLMTIMHGISLHLYVTPIKAVIMTCCGPLPFR